MNRAATLFAVVLMSALSAQPQACPSPGDLHALPAELPMCTGVQPKGWQPGATVNVYISDIFDLGRQLAIENAYNNWNAREGSGLFVIPHVFHVVEPNPVEPYSEWQVLNDLSCNGFTACTHDYWCPHGYEQLTQTNVQPSYSGTGDQLFAHEVGHTYGFDECTAQDCYPGVTIMEQDQADEPYSPMAPHCCDSKVMYQISGGGYGQSDNYCSPTLVQQGTAFLTPYPGNQTYASATFPNPPQSGDAIIADCLKIHYDGVTPTVSDNQGNGTNGAYSLIIGAYVGNAVPVVFDTATQIVSSQSNSFTVTCSSDQVDTIDLFALEVADLLDGSPAYLG